MLWIWAAGSSVFPGAGFGSHLLSLGFDNSAIVEFTPYGCASKQLNDPILVLGFLSRPLI